MKKTVIILIAILILLAALAAVVLLILTGGTDTPEATEATKNHLQENTSGESLPEASWPEGTEGLIFELNADETAYTVIGCTMDLREIVVPRTHQGLPVTAIGQRAFYDTGLEEILLPDTIRTIEPYAFMKTNLERIQLPEGLTAIEGGTFQECVRLKEVIIPSTVTRISDVEGDGGDPVMYIVGAFWGCTALERIEIPGNVKQIGHFAFEGCTNLKEVVLHEGLEEIVGYVFVDCTSLIEIHIPGSIQVLDEYAFTGSGVSAIHYPGTGAEFFGIHHVYYGDEMTITCADGILET